MGILVLTLTGSVICTGVQLYSLRQQRKRRAVFLASERKVLRSARLFSDQLLISSEDKVIDRNLAISSVAVVLSTASLAYPPLLLLSLSGVAYGAKSVFQRAYTELVHEGKITWSTVESCMLVGLFALRRYSLLCLDAWLIALSHKLLTQTKAHSRKTLVHLFHAQPRLVWVRRNHLEQAEQIEQLEVEIPIEDLCVGDLVVVRAGESVPVDGRVVEGLAQIDQHLLTGEAQPVDKGIGDPVFAATLVLSGTIGITVERAGAETVAASIGKIWNDTSDFTSSVQLRAERIAQRAALPALTLSALTYPFFGPVSAVGVLLASPGTVERILGPISLMNFFRLASQRGLLVKDGRALELLRNVDTVVFDKTGTLTLEQPHLAHIYPCPGYHADALLTYAAIAETRQSHPIARAIVHAATRRALSVPVIEAGSYKVGYGVTVRVAEHVIRVGSRQFMQLEGIPIPAEIKARQEEQQTRGSSLVYVAIDDQLGGALELRATVRPEAKQIVQQLQHRQLSLLILSGDHEHPTQQLTHELGIEQYIAEVLPQDKAAVIKQLQREGRSVCFIGDGLNDAIALKQADVSISLRGASTIATDTAQIILMDQTLHQLDSLFSLAQHVEVNMNRTLGLSLLANAAAVAGLYVLHLGLTPVLLLSYGGMLAGGMNAMAPLFRSNRGFSGS